MKMIILLSLLTFVSCSKTGYSPIEAPPSKEPLISTVVTGSSDFSEDIDVLVAFLWPKRIETEAQRRAISGVIATSRKLKRSKEAFLERKRELKNRYQEADCVCALDGICEETDTEDNLELCEEIETEISVNNQSLAEFYQLVEEVKRLVDLSGGEWLGTNTDYPLLPVSKFYFDTLQLSFQVFGDYEEGGEKHPFTYEINEVELRQEKDYQRLVFNFPRQFFNQGRIFYRGQWQIDVALTRNKGSMTFQGELRWLNEGREQLGVIYWENPLR